MYHIYRLLPDILAPRDSRIHIDPETRKCCQESLIGFFSQLVISNLHEIKTNSPICIKKKLAIPIKPSSYVNVPRCFYYIIFHFLLFLSCNSNFTSQYTL